LTQVSEWERCKPWIEAALARDPRGRTIEDIERDIAEGKSFLLAAPNSAMVCSIIETRALHIYLGGGDLAELKQSDKALNELARRASCTQVTIWGRKGWERELRPFGFEPLLMREVPDEAT
jgi:hypothetical protein